MIRKTVDSIPFYFFNRLSQYPSLLHYVSTREGGVSEGHHSSFNLSLRVEDNKLNVYQNREILSNTFGIDPLKTIFSSQTHEDKVFVVDESFLNKEAEEKDRLLFGVDAMVTSLKDVCLCILTADCASVLLYDPKVQAIGIAHAGWKGTEKKIAGNTLETMKEKFGSDPADIVAAIGPCISAESFEVGTEVADIFAHTFKNETGIVLTDPHWHKPHVDLVEANASVLRRLGVKSENIEKSEICTYLNYETFFSARRHARGRFAAGMMLR
jgi:YfiH family protein